MADAETVCEQTYPLSAVVQAYTDTLFRISFSITGSAADTEDILQNVFLKYHTKKPLFRSWEHCKAWLIRVTINESKNLLRFRSKRQSMDIDALAEVLPSPAEQGIFLDILLLPDRYKTVLYLYYVEGYKTAEIAQMLGISPAAVRKRLEKGRKQLKLMYDREAVL